MTTDTSKTLYAVLPMLGPLDITAESFGVIKLELEPPENLQNLLPFMEEKKVLAPVTLQDTVHLQVVKQLEEYLAGTRRHFDIRIGILIYGIQRRVLDVVKAFAYGETATYEEIAGRLGDTEMTKTVQAALAKNPVPVIIPCHRAVKSSTDIGGHVFGPKIKQQLLRLEAINAGKQNRPAEPLGPHPQIANDSFGRKRGPNPEQIKVPCGDTARNMDSCPQCRQLLVHESGCLTCLHCGYSACG